MRDQVAVFQEGDRIRASVNGKWQNGTYKRRTATLLHEVQLDKEVWSRWFYSHELARCEDDAIMRAVALLKDEGIVPQEWDPTKDILVCGEDGRLKVME